MGKGQLGRRIDKSGRLTWLGCLLVGRYGPLVAGPSLGDLPLGIRTPMLPHLPQATHPAAERAFADPFRHLIRPVNLGRVGGPDIGPVGGRWAGMPPVTEPRRTSTPTLGPDIGSAPGPVRRGSLTVSTWPNSGGNPLSTVIDHRPRTGSSGRIRGRGLKTRSKRRGPGTTWRTACTT